MIEWLPRDDGREENILKFQKQLKIKIKTL